MYSKTTQCIGTVFWSYLVMGDELGSATGIDRLLVSSGPSTTIFTLIGNDEFWSSHTDFVGQQCRQKMAILSFLGYLGEFESHSETV